MNLAPSFLLWIDRRFRVPHRMVNFLSWNVCRKNGEPRQLVIKLMGLGSLIRFAALCDQQGVRKENIMLISFEAHRELASLFGFTEYRMIRTASLFSFLQDCLSIFRQVRNMNISLVLDLERCSHAVGLFSTLLARRAKCRKVSFENSDSDIKTSTRDTLSVRNRSFIEILKEGLSYLSTVEPRRRNHRVAVQSTRVMVNINASNYLLARRYPKNAFGDLIYGLHEQFPALEFHFTGSARESSYVDELVQALSGKGVRAVNRAGVLTLAELSGELSSCVLFITGDSGPLHLAAFLRVPTLALWGPTQPLQFGYEELPYFHHATLAMGCSPCFRDPTSQPAVACRGQITCMKFETAALVNAAAVQIQDQLANREVNYPEGIAQAQP